MKNKGLPTIIACFYLFYSLLFSDNLLISDIGLAFTIFIFLDFVIKLGNIIPIKETILVIASLQWILGASISYNIGVEHYRYYMYVDEGTYMGYVVPSVILLWMGLSLINVDLSKTRLEKFFLKNTSKLKVHAYLLIGIGLLARILSSTVNLAGLNFFLYLLSLLLILGIIYLFYCFPKRKWLIFGITLTYFFITSVNAGLFHDFLLTAVFLSFFLISPRLKLIFKISLLALSFLIAFTIQSVKGELRSEVWSGSNNQNAIGLFWSLVEAQFFQETNYSTLKSKKDLEETEEVNNTNSRLNQGWIISKIMSNIPKNKEFVEGETIFDAISASFLPRILFPNKKGALAGIENFQEITGLRLLRGTSMGLSITGEFYANFGIVGGWIAIFIYGLLIAYFIKWLVNKVGKGSPVLFIWMVLMFYQVVKAETELIKIINHLFKSLVVFYIIKIAFNTFNEKLVIEDETP